MKLEVGMYVRTINGIKKFIKETNDVYAFDEGVIIKPDNVEKYIIKASHNIIDLIEIGDLVLINVIEETYLWKKGKWIHHLTDKQDYYEILNSLCDFVKIDGILIHEQFEKYCYKIGG